MQSPTGLAAAEVATADAVICASTEDSLNLEMALLARRANPGVRVVARIANPVLRQAMARSKMPSDASRSRTALSLAISLKRLSSLLLALMVVVTFLAIFAGLTPNMPSEGLDPSWRYAMNQVVADRMPIGKQIVFSFGPYASLYTNMYHPGTDHLMVFGGLFLGLCYSIALLYVAAPRGIAALLLVLVLAAWATSVPSDTLFLSYPVILALAAHRFVAEGAQEAGTGLNLWRTSAVILLIAPLGLLPLIKGSFLLLCVGVAVMISVYMILHRRFGLAVVVMFVPVVAAGVFWVLSGQGLGDLPAYLVNMAPIISGYTEAMNIGEGWRTLIEPVTYLATASVVIWALSGLREISLRSRLFLVGCFALFLFLSFKAGFVRHDGHDLIAAGALVMAAMFLGLLKPDRRFVFALVMALVAFRVIDKEYFRSSPVRVVEGLRTTYVNAWRGAQGRISDADDLGRRFDQALAGMREGLSIPPLSGTTDIYPFDQAYLLASNNQWNPRPVFQSYAAYMPILAQLNESHLRSEKGPDNVIFRVQPIDGRLPAIEDGVSWLALIDNYVVRSWSGQYLFLRRREIRPAPGEMPMLLDANGRLGESVTVPMTDTPIFAQVQIEPTLLGRMLSVVFKPPRLKMTLHLVSGKKHDYLVISGMMKSGFFLSPLVEDTWDFALLATGNLGYLDADRVTSFSIMPQYGAGLFWSETFGITLKEYQRPAVTRLPDGLFQTVNHGVDSRYRPVGVTRCEGAIDLINGMAGPFDHLSIDRVLRVEGWTAVAAKSGEVPDAVFVTLKDEDGEIQYVDVLRFRREDVEAFYGSSGSMQAGFSALVDTSGLRGDYVVGISRVVGGVVQECEQFSINVKMGERR